MIKREFFKGWCAAIAVASLVILIILSICPQTAFPQGSSEERADEELATQEIDDDEREAAMEMGESVTGKVLDVNEASQTILIRIGDSPMDRHPIAVNKETTFISCSSLADISAGDTVQVDYYTLGGRRIADTLILEGRSAGKETLELPEKVLSD